MLRGTRYSLAKLVFSFYNEAPAAGCGRFSQGVLQVFLREHRHRREVGREDGHGGAVGLAVSE